MNCNRVEDLLPAYALGALEPAQHRTVEKHVGKCPRCGPLAAEQLQATAALASLATQATPPPYLRSRIMAAAAQQRQESPSGWGWGIAGRPRLGIAAFSAAGVSLVLLGVLLGTVLGLQREMQGLREENRQLASMVQDQRDFDYVAALPGITTVLLENTGQARTARGMLMVSQNRTWGMLVSQGLAPLDSTKTYQVWFFKEGEWYSGGLLAVDESGYGQLYIQYPYPYDEMEGMNITVEPSQGSQSPTSSPVLKVKAQ